MKRCLVTGASSDLGQAIARALASNWALTLTGRDPMRLGAIAGELGAEALVGDLSDAAFREELTRDRPYQGFVHAASHRFDYRRFHGVDARDAEHLRMVDHHAPVDLLTRIAPEMMAARYGRIALVTSLAAQVASPGATLYAVYKAALEGLVRGLAVEYGRFGVTANAVAPGLIATRRLAARTTPESLGELTQRTALKRAAEPAEVAAAVAFLMSPAASYITGITLPVTGGLHLNTSW